MSYGPSDSVPVGSTDYRDTIIEVQNETTLSAARRLLDGGLNPVVLNFASATTPGGGFLDGGRAQEEYLARSSALVASIGHSNMYDYHRTSWTPFYSDYAIYSPDVPVFRADDGTLLSVPYEISMITCAAVNANKVPAEEQSRIADVMASRFARVLHIGLAHNHDAIVLGAWGCGAFGNDPSAIAGLFRSALQGPSGRGYRHVVFAIVDWSSEQKFIGPFQQILLSG